MALDIYCIFGLISKKLQKVWGLPIDTITATPNSIYLLRFNLVFGEPFVLWDDIYGRSSGISRKSF